MTAIVWDGKSISADTALFSRDNTLAGTENKIRTWSKGVYATSGYVKDGTMFEQWLEGELEETPRLHKGFEAIFTEDDIVYFCDRDLVPEVASVPLGIGSAGADCEVLCRIGYTGKEAIKAAFQWRTDINDEVTVHELIV